MSDEASEFLKCPCKECGNNIEFPPSSSGNTIACPHCGEWTELIAPEAPKEPRKPVRNLSLLFSLGTPLLLLAIIVGVLLHFRHAESPPVASGAPPVAIVKTETIAIPKSAIIPTNETIPTTVTSAVPVVVEHRPKSAADLKAGETMLEKTAGNSLVYGVGEIKNDSEYQRFGVRIELDLISLKGEKIGIATDYKAVIEPHQSWRFHALIPDPKTVAARLVSIKEE